MSYGSDGYILVGQQRGIFFHLGALILYCGGVQTSAQRRGEPTKFSNLRQI